MRAPRARRVPGALGWALSPPAARPGPAAHGSRPVPGAGSGDGGHPAGPGGPGPLGALPCRLRSGGSAGRGRPAPRRWRPWGGGGGRSGGGRLPARCPPARRERSGGARAGPGGAEGLGGAEGPAAAPPPCPSRSPSGRPRVLLSSPG